MTRKLRFSSVPSLRADGCPLIQNLLQTQSANLIKLFSLAVDSKETPHEDPTIPCRAKSEYLPGQYLQFLLQQSLSNWQRDDQVLGRDLRHLIPSLSNHLSLLLKV